MDRDLTAETLITLTTDIVAAHVSNNSVDVADVPRLINSIHAALAGLGSSEPEEVPPEPAVPVRNSIKPDYIVCLEDGKKLKMLKRHLMTHYKMTPDQYRQRWNLPSDYPMVSPNYAAKRRELAVKIGLGRKPAIPAAEPAKPVRAKAATNSTAAKKTANGKTPAIKAPTSKTAPKTAPTKTAKTATTKTATAKVATAKVAPAKTAPAKTGAAGKKRTTKAD